MVRWATYDAAWCAALASRVHGALHTPHAAVQQQQGGPSSACGRGIGVWRSCEGGAACRRSSALRRRPLPCPMRGLGGGAGAQGGRAQRLLLPHNGPTATAATAVSALQSAGRERPRALEAAACQPCGGGAQTERPAGLLGSGRALRRRALGARHAAEEQWRRLREGLLRSWWEGSMAQHSSRCSSRLRGMRRWHRRRRQQSAARPR